MDSKKAYAKLQRYCAYQERCLQEVKQKLTTWQISPQEQTQIISKLLDENFVDEKRFADIYTRSKFGLKKWGKNKITQQLQLKKIPTFYIEEAIANNITSQAYQQTIETLIEKKTHTLLKESDTITKKMKIVRYMFQKGYEPELVWPIVHKIVR